MFLISLVNAFLWRMGGYGVHGTRKVGYPVLVGVYGITHQVNWILVVLAIIMSIYAVSRPFTYKGDSINWTWIWMLSVYFMGPLAIMGVFNIYPLAWGLAATLSNIPKTARIFTWEFCECLCGVTCI